MYRLEGELTLRFQGADGRSKVDAEACFRKGLQVARQQQSKSWELRAATSLARLRQQQGKQTEAHGLKPRGAGSLYSIYYPFIGRFEFLGVELA